MMKPTGKHFILKMLLAQVKTKVKVMSSCRKTNLTTRYFGIGVLLQMCIQHSITDLVTHLICGFKYILSKYFDSAK